MPHRPLALAAGPDPAVNDLIGLTLNRAGFRVEKVPGRGALDGPLTATVRLVVLDATQLGGRPPGSPRATATGRPGRRS
jgi:hypothetical protein